jgi:hypothetical protein
MQDGSVQAVEFGQAPTRGVMVWWERHGRLVFVFFVIIALVMVMPFLPREPGRDLDRPEGQSYVQPVQTVVSGPSPVITITVSAAVN